MDAKGQVQPGQQRAVIDQRDQRLGFVVEPLGIAKTEEDQDQAPAQHLDIQGGAGETVEAGRAGHGKVLWLDEAGILQTP
ncbi:hypothetical protein D3C72_2435200 [compost metagenome]